MVDDEYFISEKFPNPTNGILMTFCQIYCSNVTKNDLEISKARQTVSQKNLWRKWCPSQVHCVSKFEKWQKIGLGSDGSLQSALILFNGTFAALKYIVEVGSSF